MWPKLFGILFLQLAFFAAEFAYSTSLPFNIAFGIGTACTSTEVIVALTCYFFGQRILNWMMKGFAEAFAQGFSKGLSEHIAKGIHEGLTGKP